MLKIFLIFAAAILFSGAGAAVEVRFDSQEKPFKSCGNLDARLSSGTEFASDNEVLFVPLKNGRLKSIKANGGELLWESDLGGEIIQAPFVSLNEFVVVLTKIRVSNAATESNLIIHLLHKNDGLVKWRARVTFEETVGNLGDLGDKNKTLFYFSKRRNDLLAANSRGVLYAIDLASGTVNKTVDLKKTITAVPFFDEKNIFLGTADREILRINSETLLKTGTFRVQTVPSTVVLSGADLIWGDDRGQVSAAELKENSLKKKWNLRTGAKILDVALNGKNLLVTSLDNYIYSIEPKKGALLWKKRLASRPNFAPLLIREYAVFLTVGEPYAFVIDLRTGLTVNKIGIAESNFFTGAPKATFSRLFLPTAFGIFSYASADSC